MSNPLLEILILLENFFGEIFWTIQKAKSRLETELEIKRVNNE